MLTSTSASGVTGKKGLPVSILSRSPGPPVNVFIRFYNRYAHARQ